MSAGQVQLVGIGCGDRRQLTLEAIDALTGADFALVTHKGDGDPLAAARQAIVDEHAPGLAVLEVEDPERDRTRAHTSTQDDYTRVVRDWHTARAEAWQAVLSEGWRTHGPRAVVLVWGDPAFYDSTIRVVEQIGAPYSVIPGISAVQLLAARHRMVLHTIGQPILVTTARRMREGIDAGADNILVMLGSTPDLDGLQDWSIWWGANLGTDSERLVHGRVGDVEHDLAAARQQAADGAGWVMDIYLIRRPRP